MNQIRKIEKLWKYLKIKHNEILIIRIANSSDGLRNYLMCSYVGNKLSVDHINEMPKLSDEVTINIVEMLGANLTHKIPSASYLQRIKESDY